MMQYKHHLRCFFPSSLPQPSLLLHHRVLVVIVIYLLHHLFPLPIHVVFAYGSTNLYRVCQCRVDSLP